MMPLNPISSSPSLPHHAQPTEQVLAGLQTQDQGLSPQQALDRLAQHGPNRLAEVKPPSAWVRLARQFHNMLLYVLMAAVLFFKPRGLFPAHG